MELPERFNAAEYFVDRNLVEGRGWRTAVQFGNQRVTYQELADLFGRSAAAFSECGVRPGDRVLILLEDSPAFAAAFWGAIRLGAIAVPLNTYLKADECAFMLMDSDARCLKIHGLWVSPLEIESALIAHPAVVECAVVGASDGAGLTEARAFVVFKESPSPALLDQVQRHLEARLPRHKVPPTLVPMEHLPKTATGKVQRFKLRQL